MRRLSGRALFPNPARIACLCITLALSAFSGGCATRSLEDWSQELQVSPARVESRPLPLMIATNQAFRQTHAPASSACPPVHVYIEGDGNTYLTPTLPSADPTPRTPLSLQLMAQDPAQALWLARPCQFLTADHCQPPLWTLARYGTDTIDSLRDALTRTLPENTQVILIGHSGGGTLALLLASRLPGVQGVVTVAGNLDVARWTRHHGYTPLVHSLDPAREPPLAADIAVVHWVGGQDRNIPAAWAMESPATPHRHVLLSDDDGHVCCWADRWPERLKEALQRMGRSGTE
jgi:hypothetical protein